jgi:hypothetical protein
LNIINDFTFNLNTHPIDHPPPNPIKLLELLQESCFFLIVHMDMRCNINFLTPNVEKL